MYIIGRNLVECSSGSAIQRFIILDRRFWCRTLISFVIPLASAVCSAYCVVGLHSVKISFMCFMHISARGYLRCNLQRQCFSVERIAITNYKCVNMAGHKASLAAVEVYRYHCVPFFHFRDFLFSSLPPHWCQLNKFPTVESTRATGLLFFLLEVPSSFICLQYTTTLTDDTKPYKS